MRSIRRKYWPDGTRKMPPEFYPVDITRNWMHQLAQSLVDKHNEDHNLVEVCSLSLRSAITLCRADTVLLSYSFI
jgi:hypothetical protein